MSTSSSKIITCKAVVCWGAGEEVKVEEIKVDPPKLGEARVKMLFASLCHTDVFGCKGYPIPLFPRVLGHEGVGMVESIGEGAMRLREGDIVIPTYIGECGDCETCDSGRANLCRTYPLQGFTGLLKDGTSRMTIAASGQTLYHFLSCSTWSEYTVVDANYLVKIDSRVALPHASFLSCGFSTGFGAAWKEAQVHKGCSVAILGLGPVGLGVVEGARLNGAVKIIGIDINDCKREKGEAFGMTEFINPKDSDKSISELVKEVTGGLGVDYSFECTGASALVNEALEAAKVGLGKLIMLGAGTTKSITIDYLTLFSARTFKFSIFGGIKVQSDIPTIIDKCINKEIEKLDELLTHEVQLEDINRAFEFLKEPGCVKVLIKI